MNPLDKLLEQINSFNTETESGKAELRRLIKNAKNILEEKNKQMFLEGFKNSGEGYNGEHPGWSSDEKLWESIKDDYNKINKKLS